MCVLGSQKLWMTILKMLLPGLTLREEKKYQFKCFIFVN